MRLYQLPSIQIEICWRLNRSRISMRIHLLTIFCMVLKKSCQEWPGDVWSLGTVGDASSFADHERSIRNMHSDHVVLGETSQDPTMVLEAALHANSGNIIYQILGYPKIGKWRRWVRIMKIRIELQYSISLDTDFCHLTSDTFSNRRGKSTVRYLFLRQVYLE